MGVRPTVPSHPQPTITASNCSLRYCDRHALFLDTETLDDTVFISDHVDRTYEHFIQVIPTIYRSRRGLTVKTYKYSATSAEHTDSDTFPSAKFTFQISPMAIVMTEKCEWGGDGWHEPSLLLPSPLLPSAVLPAVRLSFRSDSRAAVYVLSLMQRRHSTSF